MIELNHISKQWSGFALRDINVAVSRGEYLCVLGPTGVGKTLLLETVAGHHRPDTGAVRFDGRDVTSLPPERRGVGLLYQDCWLFPNMSVADNICFSLRLARVSRVERQTRSAALADLFDMPHLLQRSPTHLSAGERRKVALARALASEPAILLLDEPLGALDRNTRERVRREIRDLHDRLEMTTVHVTHDHGVARASADRIAIMDRGQLRQVGTVDEVFDKPQCEFVAQFLGCENILRGTAHPAETGLVKVALGSIEIGAAAEVCGAVYVCVRPEHICLSVGEAPGPGWNRFRGTVKSIDDRGSLVGVAVEVSDVTFQVSLGKREFLRLDRNVSSQVCVEFLPSAVHVFEAKE